MKSQDQESEPINTAEPWRYAYEGSGQHSVYAGDDALFSINQGDGDGITDKQAEWLVRRIVDCVNTCAGVPTDKLDQIAAFAVHLNPSFDPLKRVFVEGLGSNYRISKMDGMMGNIAHQSDASWNYTRPTGLGSQGQ